MTFSEAALEVLEVAVRMEGAVVERLLSKKELETVLIEQARKLRAIARKLDEEGEGP